MSWLLTSTEKKSPARLRGFGERDDIRELGERFHAAETVASAYPIGGFGAYEAAR